MRVACERCRQESTTTACWYCRNGVLCVQCDLCTNPNCGEIRRQATAQFLGGIPSFRAYEGQYAQELQNTLALITEDAPTLKRKRRMEPHTKSKVARRGETISSNNSSTLRLEPIDISIVSWNINHFNKAEAKKRLITWLFQAHPWLDVVVLQEVNEAGRAILEPLLQQLEGIGYRLGPKMRGASPTERGPKNPGDAAEKSINIAGKAFTIREYKRVKSFTVKIQNPKTGNDEWIWMRPNQPEYYPILYRKDKIEIVDEWATWDGAVLKEALHYWAKKPYQGWLKDLSWPPKAKTKDKFTEATIKSLLTGQFGSMQGIELGRQSYSQKSRCTKKPFTHDGDAYYLRLDDAETLSLYGNRPVIPSECRPAIVYKARVLAGSRQGAAVKVNIAVIHTTPAGSKFNRAGELVQVQDLFAHMQRSSDYWIAAGDYYLDPESKVQESDTRSGALFRSVLDTHGLKVVIAISGTNQSHIRNFTEDQLKDQVEHYYIDKDGELAVKRVVNKRADFLVVTPNFDFTYGGLVCPLGGLIQVDPNHKALDWWSTVSDHAPVGGILCSGERGMSWKYSCHQLTHQAPNYEERMDKAYEQIEQLHRSAAAALAEVQRKLIAMVAKEAIPMVVDTTLWHHLTGQELIRLKSEQKLLTYNLHPSDHINGLNFPIRALIARLAIVVDSVFADPYVQKFGVQRPYFDQREFTDLAKPCEADILVAWMQYWNGVDPALIDDITDKLAHLIVSCCRMVTQNLRLLNVYEGDIDLIEEDPEYDANAEIDVNVFRNEEPGKDKEDSVEGVEDN